MNSPSLNKALDAIQEEQGWRPELSVVPCKEGAPLMVGADQEYLQSMVERVALNLQEIAWLCHSLDAKKGGS